MTFPVAVFCYNRPLHLKKTLASLRQNSLAEQTILYVFSDGPASVQEQKSVKAVRDEITKIKGFKELHVTEKNHNQGLASSVISGVSEVLKNHEACIVLEDDLEVSADFLEFMNTGLDVYAQKDEVFSVSGYCPPIQIPQDFEYDAFRFPRINSWGWGTWANRWNSVDWEVKNFDDFIFNSEKVKSLEQQGKDLPVMLLKQKTGRIGSWAVRFNQACFEAGKTNVYPVRSLVHNRGIDGSGTHMKASVKYKVGLVSGKLNPYPSEEDPRINRAFRKFYEPSLFRQAINRFRILKYRVLNR